MYKRQVLGEAVGAVVLKRLDRALADGDHVHAVLLGSGTNGDGKTNGITAPSARSQAELITRVHRRAGVRPEEIGYVEAHGTATPLGDPIEVKALKEAFGDAPGRCGLGSVKANIGHTTTAAGVAALVKLVLSLKHRRLAPTPGFTSLNTDIDLTGSPFFMVTESTDWPAGPAGRRIGAVSSFGFSGTNCHLVVAEPPARPAATAPAPAEVLVPLSATSEAALTRRVSDLAVALAAPDAPALADVAFTLATGRRHLPVRAVFGARDLSGLRAALAAGATAIGPVAEAYLRGEDVDWRAVLPQGARRVPLPGYPFTRDRYWPAEQHTGQQIEHQAEPNPEPPTDPSRFECV